MEPKKISFGFTKVTQKPNLLPKDNTEGSKIELIDCLEGQAIKIKDAVEKIKTPLVIPIRDNSKNLLERVKEIRKVKIETVDTRPDSELSLDELAAKQLVEEAKTDHEIKNDTKVFKLPTVPDMPAAEDIEESSWADYENIPIEDYGLAMLRGMGWTEGSGIGKNQRVTMTIEPELRPKGMGLGARKMVNAELKPTPIDKDGKELVLVKGAHAKIIAGAHKGSYCEVLGLDDESGRIIVKTTIKNLILSLNEFLVQAVTKEEYTKSSKVINNAKYEEYKEKSKIKSEVLNSSEDTSDLERKQSKQNSKSHKSSSRSKNSEAYSKQYRSKKHKVKFEHKAETHRSGHRSRSRSYDQKSRPLKHRTSSYSSETDHSDSSVERKSTRDSDSSDYDYCEKERKRDDGSSRADRRKKKSKKQKHEHKKSKCKSKKKYRDTSSDSDQSDRSYRKHGHDSHKDNHKSFRR